MRLRTWLILGYSAVLALAIFGLGMGLMTVLGLAATGNRMVEENFGGLEVASRLRSLTSAQQLLIARALDAGDLGVPRLMDSFEADARALLADARRFDGGDASGDASGDGSAALARADAALVALARAVAQTQRRAVAGGPREPVLGTDVVGAFESLRAAALDYYAFHQQAMVERGNRIRRQADRLAIALALLGAFTVLAGVLVSLRLAERLSTPMERLADAAAQVASGNFEVRVGRSGLREADLVAQRFDDMTSALGRFHAMNLDRIVAESRRLDQVVASIDEGLLIFDDAARVERINPTACEQLGLDAETCVGHHVAQLAPLAPLAAAVAAAAAQPRRRIDQNVGELKLGAGEAQRTYAWSLLPFSDAARHGLILALRDVTDARQFERMRTDFVLRASHELRTPITGMRMAFGLLHDKLDFPPDSREAELAATLQHETLRLVDLINALLDLSRLYAGSERIERRVGNVGALLQHARQRFAPMAEAAGLTLELELPPQLPDIAFDAAALDRVLDNLLGNAIRHTPDGGRITIGAAAQDDGLELWVRDTGEGIAHADRARVFEPFVQVGRKPGGVGLGLAMCREIVRQHGGSIRLDSAPGRGSCFTLSLPR